MRFSVRSINTGKASDCSVVEIGNVMGKVTATVNLAVRKRGRTTGLTYGTVVSTDATVNIDYGDGLGTHVLKNQIRVDVDTSKSVKFSDRGDSGLVVVEQNNKVVGLLFAGNDVPSNPALSGTVAYVNPIQFVLDELNVDLCTKPVGKGFSDTGSSRAVILRVQPRLLLNRHEMIGVPDF